VSPFARAELTARVVRTILRGVTAFAEGRPWGTPSGRLVTPDAR
jgi:dihydroorotase-like cyclic amidohydrolase